MPLPRETVLQGHADPGLARPAQAHSGLWNQERAFSTADVATDRSHKRGHSVRASRRVLIAHGSLSEPERGSPQWSVPRTGQPR